MDNTNRSLHSPEGNRLQRIYWLDVARAVAIISISLNHAVNRAYDNYVDQQAEFLTSSLYSTLIKTSVSVFSRIGVPLFLMISGALLLKKCMDNENGIRRFYRHNLGGLIITSEIWFFLMFWILIFYPPDVTLLEELTPGQLIGRLVQTLFLINQVTFPSTWYIAIVLPLYVLIPFLAIIRQHVSGPVLLFPLGVIAVSYTVIPSINDILSLQENTELIDYSPNYYAVFGNIAGYILYVCIGYWISQGGLKRVPAWLMGILCFLLFAGTCGVQYYAYAQPANYLTSYNFIGIVLCSAATFELIRRGSGLIRRLQKPVSYLSRISFGIYFVHIIIMSMLYWYIDISAWSRVLQLLFYEGVSVGGSILFIAVLSQIPVLRKYMFMIKDGTSVQR